MEQEVMCSRPWRPSGVVVGCERWRALLIAKVAGKGDDGSNQKCGCVGEAFSGGKEFKPTFTVSNPQMFAHGLPWALVVARIDSQSSNQRHEASHTFGAC